MSLLPVNGGDNNMWGIKLLAWMAVQHNADGTQKDPNAVYLSNPNYGAHLNGSNDDTALAAATAAVPKGGRLVLPPALIGFSTWAPPPDINIHGAGRWCRTDSTPGSGVWATSNYGTLFGGTVLVSTATSGVAVTIADATQSTAGGSIEGLAILGPGTGSSSGLRIGGSFGIAPYNADVAIYNFAGTGLSVQGVEDSRLNIDIRGCGNGYDDSGGVGGVNNNLITGQIEQTTGVALNVVGTGNTFNTLLLQANTGTVATVSGASNVFIFPWIENASATSPFTISTGQTTIFGGHTSGATNDYFAFTGGSGHYIVAPYPSTKITVNAASVGVVGDLGITPTLTGGGTYNSILGGTTMVGSQQNSISIPAGKFYQLNGPTDTTSAISRDSGTGDTIVGAGSGWVRLANLNLSASATTTTAPGAGGAGALPATPLGYVTIELAGVARKVAFY